MIKLHKVVYHVYIRVCLKSKIKNENVHQVMPLAFFIELSHG